ncbi:Fic family protein [Martelella sp. AD-3]|uniref:Fic family protein n=1 Tax=Martelella sp. AD-3 TaxID=686597 RepID=UPI000463B03A|nr:Fic family protein [Martelella sp. AD-3]AMM84632.1 cell filamentation protein Fic [Martelella sp. AD-3]
MIWNWQKDDWPEFDYDKAAIEPLERLFLKASGEFVGAFRHVAAADKDLLRIELISDEALKTSEIEGEILNRDSLQSSLRNQFGLGMEDRRVTPKERGIAEMMVDLYEGFDGQLSHETLFSWHRMVMAGERRVQTIGQYRAHEDPMQIVSGPFGRQKVHFEAPPSARVPMEMERYVDWFNRASAVEQASSGPLTRAGIAHLYFESIHPFEDGNGRIGRALSEKALAQGLGQPTLIALAYTIERNRKRYYEMLERASKSNEITHWLVWFAETVLEAQRTTLRRVEFYIAKARFYETFADRLNERQAKVIARMFREGVDGFEGGLSARNYISIAGGSTATTTRDLQHLVEIGALVRTGERRYTRYFLNLSGAS